MTDEKNESRLSAEYPLRQKIRRILHGTGNVVVLREVRDIFQTEAISRDDDEGKAAYRGAAALIDLTHNMLGGMRVRPAPECAAELAVIDAANRMREVLATPDGVSPLSAREIGMACDRLVLAEDTATKQTERIRELERTYAAQRDMLVINEGSTLGVLVKLLRGPDALAANPDFFDIVGGAFDEITMLRAQVGRLNDLKARLDVVEGEVKKTSDEHTASRSELREHADKSKTHDPVRKSLLSELHEVLIEQVPDIALSMSADDVVKLATKTVAKQVKQREQVAGIIEANAAPIVVTDKLTGHPIGCEAHFAGVRFHCHKTHKRYYEDRRQTFVTFEVYATTQLDREAINALLAHAEAGTVAPLHTALLGKVKGYARLTGWPAYPATSEAEATFQFELHATQEEAEEANRHRFGHQGHVDQAKVMLDGKVIAEGSIEMLRGETVPRSTDLYQALVDMMALLWKARFHAEPATEDARPAAEFVNEHQATLEKLADAFADPLDDFLIVPLGAKDGAVAADESAAEEYAQAYAKGFEPFVALEEVFNVEEDDEPDSEEQPTTAPTSIDGRKAEVLARLRVGPWTFQNHSPPDKLTLDALKSLLDDGLCFTYAGPKGWEFSTVWEASPTTDEAEVMAATLSLIDGGTLISTYKGGPPAGGPRTEAALKKLADFGTIERWEDGNHICYGSRATRAKFGPNAGAYTKPHASPFEGKPFDDTDPRNQVHALIDEHGSYGRPFGKSLSFNRDGLLVNDQPHAMNEPIKLVVALLELEQAAPTDLKGYGFTDAAMLVPAASNATREHAAICLAYAGLLHDLRQALQRSLSGLATSAKYNAEQSSDMLAYWTAELARMPVPTAPATKPTPAS